MAKNSFVAEVTFKENSDISGFILSNFNDCINNSTFRSLLEPTNIKPVSKMDSKSVKNDHQPVRVLSYISKVYERFMFVQLSGYFQNFFPKY